MNNRFWLWLLPIASLSLAPYTAAAQAIRISQRGTVVRFPGDDKQSHRELPGGPDMDAGPELMAERLRELRQLHQLQDQIQGLLKDPDFKNRLRNQFSDDELRRLREKILKGDLEGDRDWNKLLQQTAPRNTIDGRKMEALLRRLAERAKNKPINPPSEPKLPSLRPSIHSGSSSSDTDSSNSKSPFPPAKPADPSLWERLRNNTSNWIADNADGLAGDMAGALAESGINDDGSLAELVRTLNEGDFLGEGFIEEAAGLSRYLPNMGALIHERLGVPDEMRSLFRDTQLPSLRGLDRAPSLPTAPSTDGGWVARSLALLTLGVLLLLVWKMGGWSRGKPAGTGDDWQLGSWPVAPTDVSTRQELIRAFEYLVLLCLGPDACTCHHRELADRLAAQEGDDPARRRQAVEVLAWLYEQARYAPAEESLSQEELSEAHHALRFLAGVTTP